MDASQITKLLQKQNTRYINRSQTVDSSTLIWQNQIQSSKYIKGVKTCEGNQNWNVPTNPACSDGNGICSFGGAGRTTTIQTGSSKQVLNVLSGAAGSASEVYSSERIMLQKAGKEACGVPGTTPITTTTTDNCGNTTTTTTNNTYITLPACYCENTNGPTGPRYNVIEQNSSVGWTTRIGSNPISGSDERINSMIIDSLGNIYITFFRLGGSGTNTNSVVVSNYTAIIGGGVQVSTYGSVLFTSTITSLFIVKYNPAGQAQWVTKIDNVINDQNTDIKNIAVDSSGNVYVGVTSANQETNPTYIPQSISLYNATPPSVPGGNIPFTVYATMNVGNIPPRNAGTSRAIFLVKYSPSGQVIRANTITTIPIVRGSQLTTFNGISIVNDRVYVAGSSLTTQGTSVDNQAAIMFYNSATVSGGTITPQDWGRINLPAVPTFQDNDPFIVNYDLNLNPQWGTIIAGNRGQQQLTMTTDSCGNIYVAVIQSSTVVGDRDLTTVYNFLTSPTSAGGAIGISAYGRVTPFYVSSTIIVKYNSSGQCQGVSYIRDNSTSTNLVAPITSMSVDANNNLCVTGYFSSTNVNIYNAASSPSGTPLSVNLESSLYGILARATGTNINALIIKYNSNLQVQWATRIDGAFGVSILPQSVIRTDSQNNIYVSGRYSTSAITINNFSSVIPGSTISVSPYGTLALGGTQSVFLVKYNPLGSGIWATSIYNINRGTTVLTYPIIVDSQNNIYIGGSFEGIGTNPNKIITINNYSSITPPTINVSTYASLANTNTADSFLVKYQQPTLLQEIPLPINNQSNPYLPPFDTYYAMKNPSAMCNYPVQDQNQKHFVKECHSRFPNANNGPSAACEPCDNNMYLNPVTKQFETNPYSIVAPDGKIIPIPITCDGCILEQQEYIPPYCVFCEWATYLAGTGNTVEQEVARDSVGNAYVTGYYSSTAPVIVKNAYGPTQTNSNITLPAFSTLTVFIIKYNSAGQAQWATYLSGSSNDIGYSVTVDSSDNVIIAGQYSTVGAPISVTQWDSTTQTIVNSTISLPATASTASYIIKYSSAGAAIWAARLDGSTSDNDIAQYITVDSSNNIYVTGNYYTTGGGTMRIYNGVSTGTPTTTTISLPAPGTAGAVMFLIKYDASGIAQWATYLGGSGGTSLSQGSSLVIDSSFNVYVTGLYRSSTAPPVYNGTITTTAPIASGITLLASSTGAAFVIKYTQIGNNLVASAATLIESAGISIDSGQSIAIDSSGGIVVTGYYTGIPTIYNASGNTQAASSVTLQYPTTGNTLAFIVKYSTALQAIWATYLKSVTGTSQGNSIAAGPDGYIYVTGQYTNNVTLMNAAANSQTESMVIFPGPGYTQMYMVKYDLNGQAVCATYIQTGTTSTIGQSVTLDRNNNIFVSGQYAATAPVVIYDVFKTGVTIKSAVSLPASSTISAFLIKYTQD